MFNIPQIIKNKKLNHQLFENGFLTFQLLDYKEVEKLKGIYHKFHHTEQIKGLYVSSNIKEWEELIQISNLILKTIQLRIDGIFINIQKIGGTFIVKPYDPDNILHPHQDWNIVDETKHRSFTIWIALQDINDENGALYVLPKSHNWIRGYRHTTIPSVYGKIYDLTWQYMQPVHLKAGEAIVFDHALVHASLPNKTKQLRIAATCSLLTVNATFKICCNENGIIKEFDCPKGFHVKPEALKAPFNLSNGEITNFKMKQLNEIQFLNFVKESKTSIYPNNKFSTALLNNKTKKYSIFDKIKTWLK